MRTIEVHDVKTGPVRNSRHKICPLQGPSLVDAVKA
jgi:hypothetical protein